MVVRSILVPTDFSPTSDAALKYATQMALTLGARLYLMHVPGKTGEHFEANYPLGRFETATRERLSAFLTTEELERLRPEYALRVGAPADEIVRYADACDADLIIMGTHGRSGIAQHGPAAESPRGHQRQRHHDFGGKSDKLAHRALSYSISNVACATITAGGLGAGLTDPLPVYLDLLRVHLERVRQFGTLCLQVLDLLVQFVK